MGSSYARLFVHLVWATKLREPWIEPSIAPRLHGMLATRCQLLNCVAIAIGGVEEHVHVLVGLHPSVAVADLVRDLKATTSTFMRHTCGQPKFEWQEGYGAFSLRDTDLDVVRSYIRNQPTHHATGDVVDEWERVSPPRDRSPHDA
ncbi:MAG: IS200/IS605 family transposase [Polyangiales bacterium]